MLVMQLEQLHKDVFIIELTMQDCGATSGDFGTRRVQAVVSGIMWTEIPMNMGIIGWLSAPCERCRGAIGARSQRGRARTSADVVTMTSQDRGRSSSNVRRKSSICQHVCRYKYLMCN